MWRANVDVFVTHSGPSSAKHGSNQPQPSKKRRIDELQSNRQQQIKRPTSKRSQHTNKVAIREKKEGKSNTRWLTTTSQECELVATWLPGQSQSGVGEITGELFCNSISIASNTKKKFVNKLTTGSVRGWERASGRRKKWVFRKTGNATIRPVADL